MSETRHSIELRTHRAPFRPSLNPCHVTLAGVNYELARIAFDQFRADQVDKNNESFEGHAHSGRPFTVARSSSQRSWGKADMRSAVASMKNAASQHKNWNLLPRVGPGDEKIGAAEFAT